MSTIQVPYRDAAKFGFKYTLEFAGDGLPEHSHPPELEHDVYVHRGRVAIILETGVVTVPAKARIKFDSSRVHRIVALEPSVIINIVDAGLPAIYAHMTDQELSDVIHVPLDLQV